RSNLARIQPTGTHRGISPCLVAMGRGPQNPKGVKKVNVKPGKGTPKPQKLGTQKDAASFLKQRLNQKVKNLRIPGEDGMELEASVHELLSDAARRGEEFAEQCQAEPTEEEGPSGNANREAENTRKQFYTELRKVLRAADVIIEVLDARDPGACRCSALEREVTSSGKRLILLLNKIDLVPREAVQAWMKHLHRSHPAIAFKACHGGATRATHAMTSAGNASDGLLRSTHAVVGADELMQLLKNYSRQSGTHMKGHISVGVVGYPNTGKSSVINSMKRHSAVETGARAGVTRMAQEVQLDSKVTLIDSPGVVFEGSGNDPSTVLRNVVRVESVSDPVAVVEALALKAPRQAWAKAHNVQRPAAASRRRLVSLIVILLQYPKARASDVLFFPTRTLRMVGNSERRPWRSLGTVFAVKLRSGEAEGTARHGYFA
ncbi:unnamed protein product, partial [Effrenium voratum]